MTCVADVSIKRIERITEICFVSADEFSYSSMSDLNYESYLCYVACHCGI